MEREGRDRAAIYARFSSHNQRSESIEIQLEKSRAFCRDEGLRVVREYCDYAQTGRTTDRAGFQEMMADARRGLFDFVVIYKVTRIMRNRDEMAMARIMLRRSRVDILYAGEDIADGSAGVLQLGMLEVLAEYESALDSERIRDGIRKNAERCMANGQSLYGWDIGPEGTYVINEAEAAVVRMGVEMVLEGRPVSEVVRAWAPYPTKKGGRWRHQTVLKMLRRRQNGGEYRYAGVVVPGGMPAIVPMEEEEAVIRVLDRKHKPRGRYCRDGFPLTGKLFHGADWSPMTGTSGTGEGGGTYYYYRCRACGRTVRRDRVEAMVADAVREALSSPENRERIASLVVEANEPDGSRPSQVEVIEGELAKIESAYANIWRAIEEGVAPPGGRERIDELRHRQDLLRDELAVARSLEAVRVNHDRVLFWLEDAAARLDDEFILRTFVSRVVLGDGGDGDEVIRVEFTFDEHPADAEGESFEPIPPGSTIGESRGPAFRIGERALACFGV